MSSSHSGVPFQCSLKTRAATLTCEEFYNPPVFAGLVRTIPLALAFAGLLQSNPTAAQHAVASASQATVKADQETKQGVEEILATIIQSGSTNTRAYKVVIHNDGSATAEIGGASSDSRTEPPRSQQFPPGTIDTKTLRRLLMVIGDVSRIPIGACEKSVSFGTRTQINYASKTSGDLQCIRQPASGGDQALLQASEDLGRFVQTSMSQLKINVKRVSRTSRTQLARDSDLTCRIPPVRVKFGFCSFDCPPSQGDPQAGLSRGTALLPPFVRRQRVVGL
jgi:hypothetical protein